MENSNLTARTICAICGEQFNRNHLRKHKLPIKEYYIKYLKKENEGICETCGKPTKYVDFKTGFRRCCSNKCANHIIGNNKKNKYEKIRSDNKLIKICKKCEKEFETNKQSNHDYCYRQTCRKHNYYDIIDYTKPTFFESNKCNYCGKSYNTLNQYIQHLHSHFSPETIKIVFLFIFHNILNHPFEKCSNPDCTNERSFVSIDKGYYKNSTLCDDCRDLFYADRKKWIHVRYSDQEYKDRIVRQGNAIRISRKNELNTEEGLIKWKKIWKTIGEKNKINTIKFNSTEKGKIIRKQAGIKISKKIQERIKNGSFVPCITNSWTHWDASVIVNNEIVRFRSSWEACFWLSNQHLKYEFLRIPYYKYEKEHIYIPDFYDKKTNTIYEIKPITSYLLQIEKMNEIIKYCIANNVNFVWVNENNILNYIDKNKFEGENIKQLIKLSNGIKESKYCKNKKNKE